MDKASPFDPSRLLKRIRVLPELTMRREVLVEHLLRLPPEGILAFLHYVQSGALRRNSACMVVLDAVHESILQMQGQDRCYELMSEVYRLARQQGDDAVCGLLMVARPHKGPVDREEIPSDLEMSQLSLGERKSLARGHNKAKLERLLQDPEPAVMRNLLKNPHLVESDVLRVASRRPVNVEVLRELYASKWSKRYRIRLALVSNPYTPTDLSLKLIAFLTHQDLRAVAADGNLHRVLRHQAKTLVAGRRLGQAEQ